ncbi:hypothetical protein CHLRE_12g524750v5 [Chlamydomonas reinhardtii]|uniref:Fido domain-containing protein n=1 Tax=Chlamydomonas reinhardtii TaxID=3055 RepID=A0A2K3D4D3_CHLRE|nr:uncharacterized protein CHLRE_12g524750v5 [Chlamydomonas reinhardtii]PNW75379.1 hypothetical protein CHLRE_12g524750v5 [Chlamydomonas reinhardtii]
MQIFAKLQTVASVCLSNELEGTVPATHNAVDLYKCVESELEYPSGAALPEPAPAWPAEGGHSETPTQAQLQQHVRALVHLLNVSELTSAELKTTHKTLMWGATDVTPGEYRNTSAHSGTGYVYPAPELIPAGVEGVLEAFRSDLALVNAGELDVNIMAANLFYGMITLHPFQNGNGRLCGLLASYALQAAGDPFPVSLFNGRTKSRQHFQQALRYADTRCGSDNLVRLAAYILECRHFAWQNFIRNLQHQ